MTAIFISHSSADNAAAAEMKAWLGAQGHTSLFLDFDPEAGIKGGSGWEQTLYQQLRQCQAVIALLTPSWLASKWCFAELVQARERGKAIFPVKVQPCEAGGVFGDIQHIDLTAEPEEGYRRLRIGLLERGLDPQDVFHWDPKRPPYPGLLAFQEQDAAIFFGRGEEILKTLETLDALRRQGREAARFALLLGASGSGKSSLARAGVIPRLKKKPAEWLPLPPFRPQQEPLDELAVALAVAFEAHGRPRDWSALRSELHAAAQNPAGAQAFLKLVRDLLIAARQTEATVLLTIDQAEELFGYSSPEAATRFLRLLRAALEAADRQLMAVATLRSDFLGEFQNHPVLQDSEYPHHFRYRAVPVDPMPLRNFPAIIQGPARLAGLQLDDGLVEAIVQDTGTRDALPLLAFTLRRLYERYGGDGHLSVDEYESLGRLEGAIREEAQRVIAEADPNPEELEALHAAFVPSMVRINAEGGYARRRASFDDLPRRALPLLRRFVDARLLVTDRDPQCRETIEVAHEALLRTWPLLGGWLAEDQDKLRLLESLQRSAEDWDQGRRRDDLLNHRNDRLKDAEALLADPRFAMPQASVERAYLDACSAAQQAREAAEKEEQERRIRDAERIAEEQKKAAAAQKKIARRTQIGLGAVLLVAGLTVWQYFEAERRANLVLARQLATESSSIQLQQSWNSLALSVLLAVESVNYAPTAEGLGALRKGVSLLPGPPEPMGGKFEDAWAVDATGKVVVVKEQAKIVVKRLPQGDDVGALSDETYGTTCDFPVIAVSKAGKHLVIAGDEHVKVFRLEGQSYVPTGIDCALAAPNAIALSPDARVLGAVWSGHDEEHVELVRIDFAGGKCEDIPLDVGQITEPSSVAFSADGRSVAVGGTNFISKRMGFAGLWNLPDLTQDSKPQPQPLDAAAEVLVEGHAAHIAVGQISFGDGGTVQRLAAQISDGQLRVWEVIGEGLQEVARIPGGERSLLGFLDGGSALLTFDGQTKQILEWPLRGPATWEGGTALSERAPTIALGGPSNKLVTATWRRREEADVPSISTWPASGSPPLDSQWSRETWNLTEVSPEIEESNFYYALSPEGRFVLVALKDYMGSIVDIQAKKPIGTVSLPRVGSIAALGPEARVIGYVEGTDRGDSVILVDPSRREKPRTKTFSEKIGAIAFSENGKHMAVAAGGDGARTTVIRLKLESLTETARFNVDTPIATVAINGDGTLIAVAGTEVLAGNSAVRVWRVPLPSVLGFFGQAAVPALSYEVQAAEAIESVALSRDGMHLATASMPEAGVQPHLVLQVWTFSQDTLVREACRVIGRDLTSQEWTTHLPGEPYKATCTPDDAPQAAAIQSSPGAGKASSAESASAPTEAPRPGVTAPPAIQPQPEKPTAPAPVQEGDPVKPMDADDRARIGPTPVQTVSPVPRVSGDRKEPFKGPVGP